MIQITKVPKLVYIYVTVLLISLTLSGCTVAKNNTPIDMDQKTSSQNTITPQPEPKNIVTDNTLQREPETKLESNLQDIQKQPLTSVANELELKNVKSDPPNIAVNIDGNTKLTFLNSLIVFTITIENKSNRDELNVSVIQILPMDVEYVSSTPNGIHHYGKDKAPKELLAYYNSVKGRNCERKATESERMQTMEWKYPKISSGEKMEIKLNARTIQSISRSTSGIFVKVEDHIFTDEFSFRVRGPSHYTLSTYDTEDPIYIGKQTTYVITFRNENTSPCTNIQFANDIAKEMQFVEAKFHPLLEYQYDEKKRQLQFEAYPILNTGDSLVYNITCIAVNAGSAKNTARIKYDEFYCEIIDEETTNINERQE